MEMIVDPFNVSENRKYIAVSVKHTIWYGYGANRKWKFGDPLVLWGHLTTDDGRRCFGGYTMYPMIAERYALGDMKAHGYDESVKDDEPVKLSKDFCKNCKAYDTVYVTLQDALDYYRAANIDVRPHKE